MTETVEFDELLWSELNTLSLDSIELFLGKINNSEHNNNLSEKYLEMYLLSCKSFLEGSFQKALDYSLRIDESKFNKKAKTYRYVLFGRATIFGRLRIFNEEINIYKEFLNSGEDDLRFTLLSNTLVSFLRDNNYSEAKKFAPELFMFLEKDDMNINVNDKVYALYNWAEVGRHDYSLEKMLEIIKKYEILDITENSKTLLNEMKVELFNHFNKPELALQLIDTILNTNVQEIDKLYITKKACDSAMLLKNEVLFKNYFSKIIENKFTFELIKTIEFYTKALDYSLTIGYFDALKDGYEILNNVNKQHIKETRNAEFMKAKVLFHNKENELKAQQLDKIEQLNTQLKTANASLEQFGAILAHDIKSPINSINLFLDILLSKDLDEEDEKEIRNQVGGSIETINSLVDNLFMFSKKGIFENEKNAYSFNETVSLVLSNNEYLINETKTEVLIEGVLDINMNQSAIVLIMQNLILNAVKFIPRTRTPLIKVSIVENNQKKIISVKDNGAGIKKEDIDKIFDEYYRGENAKISKGLGLGLNTVKRIVDFYKGEIKIESEVGVGTKIDLVFDSNSI